MKERWRPVPGFEDLYLVSDHGRMWSVRRQRVMKLTIDAYGYLLVGLYPDTPELIKKTVKVHRLVATVFYGQPPEDKLEVDHKDRVRTNNHWRNLRWSSVPGNRVRLHSLAASGVVGVRHRPDKPNPWQAYTGRGGRFKSLGHFKTKAQAVAARKNFDLENPIE